MENTKKLAEDYYSFILKYDECFYKKYKKEETETNEDVIKIKAIFNEMLEKELRPYTSLTKGKEVEELEYIFSNNSEILYHYLKIFDFLNDQCYDLAEIELKNYYAKNNIKKSHDEILDTIEEYIENNSFDNTIFSQECIEKCNIMKEADEIYKRLSETYKNIQKI